MKPIRYGTFLSSGSPVATELAARCGLNWLLLDMEHGALTETDLPHHLRAAQGSYAVVRVPTHDAGLIGRALDAGANAIMVPHVDSAEAAYSLVEAMHWPPKGKRGYSRSVRAHGYGLIPPETVPRPELFVQIETAAAVAQVDEIVKVDGVDVLFIGPADLELSLSATPNAPDFATAMKRVAQAAACHGKEVGILVRDVNQLPDLVAMGFSRIAVNSDLSLLRTGFRLIAEL